MGNERHVTLLCERLGGIIRFVDVFSKKFEFSSINVKLF
jgi:hypothetical protein